MNKKKIDIILQKFFDNTATKKEKIILSKWAKENKPLFQQQIELNFLIKRVFKKEKSKQLKDELIEICGKVEMKKPKRHKPQYYKYAAIFIGLISLGFYYYSQDNKIIESTDPEITITFGDGSSKQILETESSALVSSTSTHVAKQEGTKIIYKKVTVKNQEKKPLVFNTLNVPYGKKFQIELSDGTEVYLNSGSSLTYPVAFYDQGSRNVTLKGEAYFHVKSDVLRPFYVKTKHLSTQVLGTEFNISNYDEDEQTKVVLVKGSLSVKKSANKDSEATLLTPNQMASYSISDSKLSVKNVDVSSYIAWKDGILLFKNEDFFHITKKLERHFDLEIKISDIKVGRERYTGRFETETIEEVLQAFQLIKEFNYNINNENKININLKN